MRAATLRRMLRQPILVRKRSGVDEYGQAVLGTAEVTLGFVVHNQRRAVSLDGVEFTSPTQVLLMQPVEVGDVVVVEGRERIVRAVRRASGVTGAGEVTEASL